MPDAPTDLHRWALALPDRLHRRMLKGLGVSKSDPRWYKQEDYIIYILTRLDLCLYRIVSGYQRVWCILLPWAAKSGFLISGRGDFVCPFLALIEQY